MTKRELLAMAQRKRLYGLKRQPKRVIAQLLIDSPRLRGKTSKWAFASGVDNGQNDTQLPFYAHSHWHTLYTLGLVLGRITGNKES